MMKIKKTNRNKKKHNKLTNIPKVTKIIEMTKKTNGK